MNANVITSLYIPHLEYYYTAEYICETFRKNGLATISSVFIEPYKSITKKRDNTYRRAYLQIQNWEATEAAYNLIQRLKNPHMEARVIHNDDNWWSVQINKKPNKLKKIKQVLTLFTTHNEENETDNSFWDNYYNPFNIVKNRDLPEQISDEVEDENAFEDYIREMDESRELWYDRQCSISQSV